MKRVLKFLMCAVLVAIFGCGLSLVLSACGHSHSFTEWQYVEGKAPTCTEDGEEVRRCTGCGKEETRVASATGHNLGAWTPTGDRQTDVCNGTHYRICLNGCGKKDVEECVYVNEVHKPTCEEAGYTIHRCETCGDQFEHDFVEKLEHIYSTEGTYSGVKDEKCQHKRFCIYGCGAFVEEDCTETETASHDADCFGDGYKNFLCNVCKNTRTQITGTKLEHNFGEWLPVEGENYHKKVCSLCQTEETAPCQDEHTYNAPTCTEDGLDKTECTICHNIKHNEVLTQLGHTYSDWHTYQGTSKEDSMHEKICEVCGDSQKEKCTNWTVEKTDATCDAIGETIEHCADCNVSYVTGTQEALGHDYQEVEYEYIGDNQHQQICKNCHKPKIESCAFGQTQHKEPNCTLEGSNTRVCTLCQHEDIEVLPAKGHTWAQDGQKDGWEITTHNHKRTCSACAETETREHTYIASNLCDSCLHDGLTYKVIDDSHAAVEDDKVVSGAKEIIVAEYYDGKPVTEILGYAFYFNKSITKVTLPKSLLVINSQAFTDCSALQTVVFEGILNPTEEEKQDTDKLAKLTTICESAFVTCNNLSEIKFPSSLLTIGANAFYGCRNLYDIDVPASVTEIGANAFARTGYLENKDSWDGDVLYINGHLILANPNLSGSYAVVDGTTVISANAFKDCSRLTEIILPKSLKTVGTDAFLNCTGLEKVEFLGTFAEWLAISFANDGASPMSVCSYLDIQGATGAIVIPESVTSIPAGAFKGSKITSVKIHAGVTYIGEEAFENCDQLETVIVDEECNLDYVGSNAFAGTPFFATKSNWTNGVLYVGHCLISGSDEMEADYTVLADTFSIAVSAFEGNKTINSIVLCQTVQYIGQRAFLNSSLTKMKLEAEEGSSWLAFNLHGAGRYVEKELINAEDDDSQKRLATQIKTYNAGYWRKNIKLGY